MFLTGPSFIVRLALVFSHGMLTSLPSSSTSQDACEYTEPTQIILHHLSSQGQLMSNLHSPL